MNVFLSYVNPNLVLLEIVLDIHAEDRYKIPDLKEVFQNTKLGRFRANVKAGKTYGTMKEIKL